MGVTEPRYEKVTCTDHPMCPQAPDVTGPENHPKSYLFAGSCPRGAECLFISRVDWWEEKGEGKTLAPTRMNQRSAGGNRCSLCDLTVQNLALWMTKTFLWSVKAGYCMFHVTSQHNSETLQKNQFTWRQTKYFLMGAKINPVLNARVGNCISVQLPAFLNGNFKKRAYLYISSRQTELLPPPPKKKT